jgi:iron-sulfur cluster assembly accessory protein
MSLETATEPVLHLTESAVSQVKSLLARETGAESKALRVYVENGGCSGMQYGLVFDEKREGDIEVGSHGVPVVLDSFSVDFLRGSTVDFVDSLNEGGFKISNPNARQSCGCGRSFEA